MKVTKITENNIKYFESVIGDYFYGSNSDDFFAGVIDDNEEAVAAAAFRRVGGDLCVRFIYVAEEHRRNGYGTALIDSIKDAMKTSPAQRMFAMLFLKDEKEDTDGIIPFLESLRFSLNEADGRRSIYEYEKIRSSIPFSNTKGNVNEEFKKVKDLSEEELSSLTEEIKNNNEYGIALVESGHIKGAINLQPFADGVRLSALYSDGNAPRTLSLLFDHAIKELEKEIIEPKFLYVDTAGERLINFEDDLMKHINVEPAEVLNAYAYVWEV